ncbi:MAG: DUF6297 family protein [Nocardioidaceae bacterium]
MSAAGAEVRAVRRQLRVWRRDRAEISLLDALSDAYIAVFAVAMITAMGVSLLVSAREAITGACTTTTCSVSRGLLPWMAAGLVVTWTLVAARLFGPLTASPAEGSWLLGAPLDRGSLLRPRLAVAAALAAVTGGALGAVVAVLSGLETGAIAAFAVVLAAGCVCAVGFAAVAQSRRPAAATVATWAVGALVWVGLLLLALGVAPAAASAPEHSGPAFTIATVCVCIVAAAFTVSAVRELPGLPRERLTPGGSLLPSLSGALASLDLALVYDILVSRRWLTRASVRPVLGGPGGAWALVWRDVIRLRRSLAGLVILAASLVVPYVGASLGINRLVAPLTSLTGFLAGLGLCSALRVVVRTTGLARCLPMSTSAVRLACVTVPVCVLVVWGLATTPAQHQALVSAPAPWPATALVAASMGLAAATSVVRWVTARPPDYSRPLVSSPGGAIPPGLTYSVLRGFDVWLLVSVPLLIWPPVTGAVVSVVLAVVVLGVLLGRP